MSQATLRTEHFEEGRPRPWELVSVGDEHPIQILERTSGVEIDLWDGGLDGLLGPARGTPAVPEDGLLDDDLDDDGYLDDEEDDEDDDDVLDDEDEDDDLD